MIHDDPPEGKRTYYRHKTTGDKAYLVVRDGKQHIKYDRPFDPTTMLFRESDWVLDKHPEPFSMGQAIQVAFAADRAVCKLVGLPLEAKKQWESLAEGERANFIVNGPTEPPVRVTLYHAIRKILEPLTRAE